jgi:hypothetical protein
MRNFPPCVAEAYLHLLMGTIESRAAAAAADGKRQPVAQRVRLIVPSFDHNYVMWPSYVEKLYVHYNEQLLARQVRAGCIELKWKVRHVGNYLQVFLALQLTQFDWPLSAAVQARPSPVLQAGDHSHSLSMCLPRLAACRLSSGQRPWQLVNVQQRLLLRGSLQGMRRKTSAMTS